MNLCKSLEPLHLTDNNARNWFEFKEQLQWFLKGPKSTKKSDGTKIGIMLSNIGKDARKLYKTLSLKMKRNLRKFWKLLKSFALP